MMTTTGSSTTRFLDRPDGRIAYEVAGDGPLIVAAPGMGDLRSVYRSTVPGLVEAGFRVATMDLRGHGESDTTFSTFDDVAAGTDLLALTGHLGGPAVLIGNSMSAGAAVWAAAEHPGSVAGLVLVGPFVRNPAVGRLTTLAFRAGLLRPWGPAVWHAYLKKLFPGRPPTDLDDHRSAIRANLREPGRWDAFVATTHTSHAPAEARLAEVEAPTLVVMGARDPDFPDPEAEARWIAERLDAEVLIVPEAGHYPQSEFPEVVTPAISSFVRRVVGRA